MARTAKKKKMGFQTEAKQLLQLMIHSLYSNREIFLRELISNASDAIDKFRFTSLTEAALSSSDGDLCIRIDVDSEAKTITLTDNGIGMSRDEAIENLGTIAKSGTAQFMSELTGDEQKDSQLIGQFGVGFYASFIVASKVVVESRSARVTAEEAVRWTSSGEADFEVETIIREARGTQVTLYLKADNEEYLDNFRLKTVIKKYADHVSVPVIMALPAEPDSADEAESDTDADLVAQDEVVNSATALWTRSRSEVGKEEYEAFYKHISHDFENPLTWSHNKVEGKLDYTSLIFVPGKAPFDLWNRESIKGLKLFVQRVFIMDDAEQFLPLYLRFIKGIVDSNDLSLNISRELLQKDPAIESMRNALTKRSLDMLDKLAKKEEEQYQLFWNEFGQVLKEGPAEDFGNKEKIAKLLRFSTTHTGSEVQDQSLDAYLSRMQPEQSKIYYVAAENLQTASNSPHLEVFKKKDIEVLLLTDRIDEWLVNHLMEFDGKMLQDVAKGSLDLGALEDSEEKKASEEIAKEFSDLVTRLSDELGEQVEQVRVTHRLTDSPACLVVTEDDMGMQMRRILESAGQEVPSSKRIFEINPEHPLIVRLDQEVDVDRFKSLSGLLYDQALLAEGGQLDDPANYVQKLNKLLLELTA